jgi:hypothetical protein
MNKLHPVTQASGATVPTWGSDVVTRPMAPQPAIQQQPIAATGSGASPIADPWQTMPKLQTPQGVGQSTYQKYSAENTASVAKKLIEDHGQAATAANARIALNKQALDLIDQSDTGPYASQIADVKNLLVSRFGIPESSFSNTPSATLALQKDLVNAATQKAKQQFGSRITQSEVMLMLKRGAPNVDMTKAAMIYLVNSDNAQSQYAVQQANDLGRYLQQGGDPNRFEAWYARAFPQAMNVHLETGKSPTKIMGDADYGRLPSGTLFIDPQGKTRRKP